MKRIIVFVLLLLLVLPVFSSPELWVGVGFASGRDYVTQDIPDLVKENKIGISEYKKGEFEFFNTIGPSFELTFFPFNQFRLGVFASNTINYVISIDGKSYHSRNRDLYNNVRAGIAYHQMFSPHAGIYLNCGFSYGTYRIATTNVKNDKSEPDKIIFNEYGVGGEFGFLAMHKSSYFKFGFSYNQPLSSDKNGWALNIVTSGGFLF